MSRRAEHRTLELVRNFVCAGVDVNAKYIRVSAAILHAVLRIFLMLLIILLYAEQIHIHLSIVI